MSFDRCCWTCGQQLHIPGGVVGWSFTLPLIMPSQNDAAASNSGEVWKRRKYREARDAWELTFRSTMARERIAPATGKRRVLLTHLYAGRQRQRDPSNLAGGCKMILDAMSRAGILVDDAERWIEAHYYQQPANESGTWIQLIELEIGAPDAEAARARSAARRTPVEGRGRTKAGGARRHKGAGGRPPRRGAPVR